MYDVVIIGAGIIGSFIAHDLSKYNLNTAVLEKESDVGNKTTMANSAIIHSGHDPKEGTRKATLNVRGNRMYESVCKELQVSYKQTKAFVAAVSKEECASLDILYEQAVDRCIPVVRFTREEALLREPNLSDQVVEVLELPSTGIVCPWELTYALAEEAVENGVEVYLNQEVLDIKIMDYGFEVSTCNKIYNTRWIINASGVYGDHIYHMVSEQDLFSITPRKGEYYVLDKLNVPLVERVIYPVPSKDGKGVLVVPTIHGNTLLGPNSTVTLDKEGVNNTRDMLKYIKEQVIKTVKNIPMDKGGH